MITDHLFELPKGKSRQMKKEREKNSAGFFDFFFF